MVVMLMMAIVLSFHKTHHNHTKNNRHNDDNPDAESKLLMVIVMHNLMNVYRFVTPCMIVMQDLMNVNRNVTPWVIVHGHRPAYATVVDTASVIQAQDQRNAFEDIFVQTGVTPWLTTNYYCMLSLALSISHCEALDCGCLA